MRTITVNGQDARVFDEGSGTPVVVLHGWGGRIESMSPVLRCLAEGHRVVAIDLPGFGDSPLPSGAWGTPDYTANVRDVVSEKGIDHAHFVGHSFGAKVSFYTAAVYPDLVDKLVIVGSPGLRTPPSAAARAKRLASRTGRVVGKLGPPGKPLVPRPVRLGGGARRQVFRQGLPHDHLHPHCRRRRPGDRSPVRILAHTDHLGALAP